MKRSLTALLLALCLALPLAAFAAGPTTAPSAAVAAPAPAAVVAAPAPAAVAVPAPAAPTPVAVAAVPAPALNAPLPGELPPEVPQVDKDPTGFLVTIAKAVKDKNYSYAVGAILMFLAWVLRRFWDKFAKLIPDAVLPWVVSGAGVVLGIAAQLIAGGSWWKAILAGLTSGACAIALWEKIFKHILPEKKTA